MDNLFWTSAKHTLDQSPRNGDLLSDIFSETWVLYADSIPRSTWQLEPRWTSRLTGLLGFFAIASMPEYIPHICGDHGAWRERMGYHNCITRVPGTVILSFPPFRDRNFTRNSTLVFESPGVFNLTLHYSIRDNLT